MSVKGIIKCILYVLGCSIGIIILIMGLWIATGHNIPGIYPP